MSAAYIEVVEISVMKWKYGGQCIFTKRVQLLAKHFKIVTP